jgi:hypothetical protein
VGQRYQPRQPGAASTLDEVARDRLVVPGLVDTHRHAWLGAASASVRNVSLLEYSRTVMGVFRVGTGQKTSMAGRCREPRRHPTRVAPAYAAEARRLRDEYFASGTRSKLGMDEE